MQKATGRSFSAASTALVAGLNLFPYRLFQAPAAAYPITGVRCPGREWILWRAHVERNWEIALFENTYPTTQGITVDKTRKGLLLNGIPAGISFGPDWKTHQININASSLDLSVPVEEARKPEPGLTLTRPPPTGASIQRPPLQIQHIGSAAFIRKPPSQNHYLHFLLHQRHPPLRTQPTFLTLMITHLQSSACEESQPLRITAHSRTHLIKSVYVFHAKAKISHQ